MKLSAMRKHLGHLWARVFNDPQGPFGSNATAGVIQAEAVRAAVERTKLVIGEVDAQCLTERPVFVPG